jgi:enamine deaminase RidA (YjgF/YER057c/UK114 family)
MTACTIERRLVDLGLKLPTPAKPGGTYVPTKQVGDLLFVSGQGPIRDGKPLVVGQVGSDVTPEQATEAARIAILNALAAIKQALGSLDRVAEIVQLRGFVNSAPGFFRQPQVVNGASDLLGEVFGESGKHVRCALGTSSLPHNIPVEIEMIVRVT